MNEIVNKFLLAGDKRIHEMYLRQLGFTYSACGPYTKNKERIQKFKERGDSRYTYQNELHKACFQHGMAYGESKYLNRRTASDKILCDKAFIIAKNPKYNGYQRGLTSFVYRFFDKKSSAARARSETLATRNKFAGSGIKNENISNKELAQELHKPIIRTFNKSKIYSSFIDNIWGMDLADMQLISIFNKGFRFLLCVIDIYSKYAWVIPLKDKKGITITNVFQKTLKESKRKPNKIWVDKGRESYNRSMKSWLQKNNIEMYSTHNEGKSVAAERLSLLHNYIVALWCSGYHYCTTSFNKV